MVQFEKLDKSSAAQYAPGHRLTRCPDSWHPTDKITRARSWDPWQSLRKDVRPVTIGIGMLCGTRQESIGPVRGTLLLCADTLATYVAGTTPITSNQNLTKIYDLPHGFYAAFSDDYHWAGMVITHLFHNMESVDMTHDGVRDLIKIAIRDSFDYAYSWFRGEYLRDQVGITNAEYLHDESLSAGLRTEAQEAWIKAQYEVPAEIIVIGQTHRGPVLYRANCREIRESSEFFVTGSGSDLALNWLNFRSQHAYFSPQRSFFHMREAKRFAELNVTVGRNTQYVIVTEDGTASQITERGTLMDMWGNEFGLRDTDALERGERRTSFETNFSVRL